MKTPSYQKLQRKVVDLFTSLFIESPMRIIEAFNQPISDRVSDGLVAVAFFEIKSGPGQSVFNVVHDPIITKKLLLLNRLCVFS